MAIKRMIRWAADNGHDKVAWTTGATQNERNAIDVNITHGWGVAPFYDKILHSVGNRYLKQWGVRVEKTNIMVANPWHGAEPRNEEEAHRIKTEPEYIPEPAWAFEITPEMRSSVLQGQPLFLAFSKGNEHPGKTAIQRPNSLCRSGGMTPEQLEREKELAAAYLQKIRNDEPLGQPTAQEPRDSKEYYRDVESMLRLLTGDILRLRGRLRELLQESRNSAHEDTRHEAHFTLELTDRWETGKPEAHKVDRLIKTTHALAQEREAAFFTSIGIPDPKKDLAAYHAILGYERECAEKNIAATPEGRQDAIERYKWEAEIDREILSNSGLAWGPGHPMWDGSAQEERDDHARDEAHVNPAVLPSERHPKPEDRQTKTDSPEASTHHDNYWHRVFGDRIPAEPNRGKGIDR
jgi:hypothetical protein